MKMNLPREWQVVELGDIFFFEKKSTLKASEGKEYGKYKFFTSSDKQTKFIDSPIFNGEYLIFSTGGKAGVHYCFKKFSASTDCLVVKVNTKILPKYVYYFLRKNIHLLDAGFQGAGLKHISKNYIKKIEILFPKNILIQQKIVTILDKAEKAKEMRIEADKLTKNFLNAVFLEMFGDIKKYPIQKLESLCSKISSGSTPLGGNANYSKDGGILFIRSQNVLMNKFSDHENLYISNETHEKMKRTWVKKNDVLLNITGASIGRTAVYLGDDDKANVNQHVCIIRIKNFKELNPIYLNYYLSSDSIQNHIKSINAGGTREALNYNQIKNFDIRLPPINIQNKFAFIVNDIERVKNFQKQSREHIENLFNNLMQKSFKGELAC